MTCGSENITRQVKSNLEKAQRTLEELKTKKDRLERDRSSASTDDEKTRIGKDIEQTKKDIEDGEKRVEQAKKDVEVRKKHVDEAVYALDKCVSYRRAVQNSFASALDRVRNEDETPRLKELARKLLGSYQDGKDGHEEQISNKTNALNTCKDSRL